ncbi:hypothetical protein SB763_32390, partial [Burkholderia sp. SIMBA_042]|uniref:hypothetical protein n=1 Tax=Burkholderia sp. SIMBA_042 TaxID=3085783 RepID=UPI00397E4B92
PAIGIEWNTRAPTTDVPCGADYRSLLLSFGSRPSMTHAASSVIYSHCLQISKASDTHESRPNHLRCLHHRAANPACHVSKLGWQAMREDAS